MNPSTSSDSSRHPGAFELGIYTFVENLPHPVTGATSSPVERMKNLMETIELADQVGLDVFAIGEHHRAEYLASSPAVVLAAAAARTRSIRLSSAVTVLSSDDPVRVFQQFAMLDLISGGRAEIMAGRGSFIESFPLFGYDLNDYDALFSEKLDLLVKLRDSEQITWAGQHRPSIDRLGVYPRPAQGALPIWVAVGGTPQSVARAARMGLPMALAIIGGMPERFAPFFDLYRQVASDAGRDPAQIPLSVNSHGFIADTEQEAVDLYYPTAAQVMNKIGRERGWAPASQSQLAAGRQLRGADYVGTPEQIIEKILFQHEIFRHQRLLIYLGYNTIEHKKMMRAVELLGTVVAPAVRQEIARRTHSQTP
ncbi:MAG: LLM class flavin-dependent oxidoreductase [Chloroflexi bacterium]|nr:LLM class flavin-dependent oxidoreductase [Chloroflexota bacterium]